MTYRLKRLQASGQTHFITFSCHNRQPNLNHPALKEIFLSSLERTRRLYELRVYGYVLMPEHVHLLISEPVARELWRAIAALKISTGMQARAFGLTPLWQARYYDRNIRDYSEFTEKLRYIHRNPVKRGLCEHPQDYPWSSFLHYATAAPGPIEIESEWTADRRAGREPHLFTSLNNS